VLTYRSGGLLVEGEHCFMCSAVGVSVLGVCCTRMWRRDSFKSSFKVNKAGSKASFLLLPLGLDHRQQHYRNQNQWRAIWLPTGSCRRRWRSRLKQRNGLKTSRPSTPDKNPSP
jgi:hypothetical protein